MKGIKERQKRMGRCRRAMLSSTLRQALIRVGFLTKALLEAESCGKPVIASDEKEERGSMGIKLKRVRVSNRQILIHFSH
jgi:hypothetical protein